MQTAIRFDSDYILELKEKKNTKRTSGAIGWALFIGELIITIIAVLIGVIFSLTGSSTEILSDSVFSLFLNVVLTLILFVVAPIACCRILGRTVRSIMPLHCVSPKLFLGSVLVGFGFNSISNLVASAFSGFFSMFGINPDSSTLETPNGAMGFVISLLTVAVVPALIEEFAFRGFILGSLRNVMPDGAAVFVSAFLFGMIHGNLTQIPFAFCMGLVLAYTTVLTNSVWPAIVIHFLNNGMSVVLDYGLKDMGPMSSNIVSCLYLLVATVILFIGIILIHEKIKECRLLHNNKHASAAKHIKWSILSPGVIFFLITVIFEMILF